MQEAEECGGRGWGLQGALGRAGKACRESVGWFWHQNHRSTYPWSAWLVGTGEAWMDRLESVTPFAPRRQDGALPWGRGWGGRGSAFLLQPLELPDTADNYEVI